MSLKTGKNLRIEDIALACGVSSATVSNVLNNRANTASPETREKVLATVRAMNYRPRALASGSRARSSNTLGVALVQSRLSDSAGLAYLNALVSGILPAALEQGYFVTLYGNFAWPDTREALRVYCDGRCDGMIAISPPADSELIAALRERGIPFVSLTETETDSAWPSVDVDNEQGARDAVRYLVSLGHRRIAFFAGSANLLTSVQRERGYRAGMAEAGLSVTPEMIYPGEYGYDSGHERAVRICKAAYSGRAATLPTALFCANDGSAFGAITALQARGLRVPEDVSVVGFDDLPGAAAECDPPLTTVRQPLAEMGAEAVRLLLSELGNPLSCAESPPPHVRLPATLVVRASTTAPPPVAAPALSTVRQP